jgi:hypothetical protein
MSNNNNGLTISESIDPANLRDLVFILKHWDNLEDKQAWQAKSLYDQFTARHRALVDTLAFDGMLQHSKLPSALDKKSLELLITELVALEEIIIKGLI